MFYTLELHISSAPITFVALLSSQYYQSETLVSQLMKILNFMSTLYLWLMLTIKGNRILGLIKRSFSCLNSSMLVCLYKSMVWPILEHANTLWALLPNGPRKVGVIQRRATKLITSLCESDNNTRLAEFQLPSLNKLSTSTQRYDIFVSDFQ